MKESALQNMESVTIGDLVAEDYRTAEVFERYGIDFCCGGKVAIAEICREKGIDPQELRRELAKVAQAPIERSQNFGAWELPFLADYIVNTHHAYLKENIGGIAAYANKIAQVHGPHHPEVIKIAEIFDKIAADLTQHLREEEERLFPAIRRMVAMQKEGAAQDANAIEQLRETLQTLGHEHDEIGAAIHEIRRLSNEYALPADACNTYMLTYKKLKEFEDDLHKHVHLENNILFPKAARL